MNGAYRSLTSGGTLPGMDLGEHPATTYSEALTTAGRQGWTWIRIRDEFCLIQRGMDARLIVPVPMGGVGVIVRKVMGPRKRFVLVEIPAAVAAVGLLVAAHAWWW